MPYHSAIKWAVDTPNNTGASQNNHSEWKQPDGRGPAVGLHLHKIPEDAHQPTATGSRSVLGLGEQAGQRSQSVRLQGWRLVSVLLTAVRVYVRVSQEQESSLTSGHDRLTNKASFLVTFQTQWGNVGDKRRWAIPQTGHPSHRRWPAGNHSPPPRCLVTTET